MPITPDHAGKTYPPTAPYEVTRVKILELAAALGDGPAYEKHLPVAPATFGVVVARPAWDALFTDPELGLRLSRIVHADQQLRYVRPLEADDVVTATLRIDKVRVRGPVEIISATVDVHAEGGEHVLTATSTFVHTREEAA